MASPVDLDDVVPSQDELDTVASAEVRTVLENIFVRDEEGELIGVPSIEAVRMCVHVCTYAYTVCYSGCYGYSCRSSSFLFFIHILRLR